MITQVNTLLRKLVGHMVVISEEKEEEHWVTIAGRPVFLGPKITATKEKRDKPVGKLVTRKREDGSEFQKREYPKWWDEQQARVKYSITHKLGDQIDAINMELDEDLGGDELDFKRVVAAAMKLVSRTGMRVGGGKTGGAGKTKDVETYGTTTLQKRHVKLDGDNVYLSYLGKDGVDRSVFLEDGLVAQALRDLVGGDSSDSTDRLFVFKKKNRRPPPPTVDVNLSRRHFTTRLKQFDQEYKPKDFRTLRANEAASDVVLELFDQVIEIPATQKGRKKLIRTITNRIANSVSQQLGNEPNTAKNSYINPYLVEAALIRIGLK